MWFVLSIQVANFPELRFESRVEHVTNYPRHCGCDAPMSMSDRQDHAGSGRVVSSGGCRAAIQTGGHTGIEPELQPAAEVGLRFRRRCGGSERSLVRVSGKSPTGRAAAGDGSAHSGTEDCDRCPDNLEERRNVRLQETECDTLAVFESSTGGTGMADKTGNGADRG